MRRLRAVALTLTLLLAATAASAQDGGARVSGFFGTSLGEGEAAIVTGGSVGYRFTPRFGFDFEVIVMPDADFESDRINQILDAVRSRLGIDMARRDFDTSGRTVAFLANFVTELPTGARWLIPYVAGGGGVASVSRSLAFVPLFPLPILPDFPVPLLRYPPGLPPGWRPGLDDLGTIQRSETDLALTVGGGVDFQLLNGLAVGADLRYLRLFGTFNDLDLTRIAGRVTYRF